MCCYNACALFCNDDMLLYATMLRWRIHSTLYDDCVLSYDACVFLYDEYVLWHDAVV